MKDTDLAALVKTYYDSQRFRIMTQNRISHCEGSADEVNEKITAYNPDKMFASYIKGTQSTIPATMSRTEIVKLLSDIRLECDACYNAPVFNEHFANAGHEMIKSYQRVERGIAIKIENQLVQYPLSKWLVANVGIGPILAGGLIAYIDPILGDLTYVSSLWKYSGYAVVDMCQTCGKRYEPYSKRGEWVKHTAGRLMEQHEKKKDAVKRNMKTADDFLRDAEAMLCHCEEPNLKSIGQRKITGQMADFNPALKKICWLVGESFVKQRGSPYRRLYEEYRQTYENRTDLMAEKKQREGGLSKGTAHINAMAKRKVIKIFLSHLFVIGKQLKGLPCPEPYPFAILQHEDRIDPFVTYEEIYG